MQILLWLLKCAQKHVNVSIRGVCVRALCWDSMQCSALESLEREDKSVFKVHHLSVYHRSVLYCILLFHKTTALLLSIKYIPKRRKCVIQCSDLREKLLDQFYCNVTSSCFALLASLPPWGSADQILFGQVGFALLSCKT